MSKKKVITDSDKAVTGFAFGPQNYRLLVIGIVVIIIGFVLMSGGRSDDPNVFNPEIFNWRRITLAPIIVLIGFIIEGVAIMKKPKSSKDSE